MKFAISGFAWTGSFDLRHLELLPKIREMGYTIFEIPMFDPAVLPVRSIREALVASGLECTICAILPIGVNPISPDAAVRKRSQQHLASCVEAAAELGATLIGGPVLGPIAYFTNSRPNDNEWARAIETCHLITPLLDTHSISLSLEPVNRAETFFLRTVREAIDLCTAVAHPRLGVTIDTFQANIEESNIEAAIATLGSKLFHMHFSENTRGILGRGHVDFSNIMRVLKCTQYQGNIVVEGFGFNERESSAPGYLWADKDVSPELFAVKSYAFCRNCLTRINQHTGCGRSASGIRQR